MTFDAYNQIHELFDPLKIYECCTVQKWILNYKYYELTATPDFPCGPRGALSPGGPLVGKDYGINEWRRQTISINNRKQGVTHSSRPPYFLPSHTHLYFSIITFPSL